MESLVSAWRRTWENENIETLLRTEAAILADMETFAVDWLRRRRESIEDVQRLVARTRERNDSAEFFAAQQEWVTAELRRVSADVEGFGRLVHEFATHQMAIMVPSAVPGPAAGGDKPEGTAAKK